MAKLNKIFSSFIRSRNSDTKKLTAFVTVGSTKFDLLIEAILDEQIINKFVSLNFRKIIIQYGDCTNETVFERLTSSGIVIEAYDFKSSIGEDIEKSDLVIGHAGAGTCLEVLRCGKPLIVVTNDKLMDNHQSELAEELHHLNYVIRCSSDGLSDAIEKVCGDAKLDKFPLPNRQLFNDILDDCLEEMRKSQ